MLRPSLCQSLSFEKQLSPTIVNNKLDSFTLPNNQGPELIILAIIIGSRCRWNEPCHTFFGICYNAVSFFAVIIISCLRQYKPGEVIEQTEVSIGKNAVGKGNSVVIFVVSNPLQPLSPTT
jgi:hypothetical protein